MRAAAQQRELQSHPVRARDPNPPVRPPAVVSARRRLAPRAGRLSKGAGKQRCRECVEASEQAASSQGAVNQAAKIEEARRALQQAEIGGSAAATAGAAARLAALEAEKVTGLKPVILGRGGRGRGRGSWRGRGGR